MKKYKVELTREELKAIQYHLRYDIDTVDNNLDWEEDLGIREGDSKGALGKVEEAIEDSYEDDSYDYEDWTDEKLKEEASATSCLINEAQCYGSSDLLELQRLLMELEKRGITPKTGIIFD